MAELLEKHTKNITKDASQSFNITFEKNDFYKMLIAEIMLFQTKRLHQQECFPIIQKQSNWKFVTLYYDFFFTSFILLLFLHRGFIFVKSTTARILEDTLNSLSSNSSICKFEAGNYFFCEKTTSSNTSMLTNDNIVVTLKKSKDNTHEALWKTLLNEIYQEIEPSANEDEKTIYSILTEFSNSYGSAFPSQTRNHFNYTPESAINDIEKKIFFIQDKKNDFIKKICSFQIKETDNWYEKAEATQHYYKIISELTNNFISDYISRGNKKNDFHKLFCSLSEDYKKMTSA